MNRFACQIGLVLAACLLVLAFPLYTFFWVYPQFTALITFEKEVSAKQIANHISKMLVGGSATGTLSKDSISEGFVATLHEAQLDFDLAKIRVFSVGGEVLYSTDAKDIGTINTNAYFTEVIARGKLFSKVVHQHEKNMEGETVEKNVVETYIPLMRSGQVLGAFEIYYDITYSGFSTSAFIEKSGIIMVIVSLLLLLCLLLLSASTLSLLKKQRQTEKQIQMLRDRVPTLYNLSPDEREQRD